MNTKWVVILGGVLSVWFVQQHFQSQKTKEREVELVEKTMMPSPKLTKHAEKDLALSGKSKSGLGRSSGESKAAQSPPPKKKQQAWQVDTQPIDRRYYLPEQVTEKVQVSLDQDKMDSLKSGGTMYFTLPDLTERKVVIDKVDSQGDSKTLIGRLIHDKYSSVLITSGKGSLYATITTHEHEYTLDTVEGEGVLYKVPPRSEIDTIETDAILVDFDQLSSNEK